MKKGQALWNYQHTENAWPIVHAFVTNSTNNSDLSDTPVLKQKLADIAQVEHNNHLRGGIVNIVGQTEISWLIAMRKLGYRYACFWFDGCWSATHDINVGLLDEIDRINAEFGDQWMVAGNIIQEERTYAHFARSLVIINIETWYNHDTQDPGIMIYDQLPWGEYSQYVRTPDVPEISQERWHLYETHIVDGYEDSVYAIQRFGDHMTELKNRNIPTPNMTHAEFNRRYHHKMCNPLLTYSLSRELHVPGLSDTLMDQLVYIKPHIGSEELEKAIQRQKFDRDKISYQANKLIDSMFAPSSPIYFVNTEPSRPDTAEQIEGSGFDQYVGVTAGFKLFYYAYKYGFNQDTKFILYDFDPLSCKFKRDLLEQWDGVDYPEFVDAWLELHPTANANLRDLTVERWPIVIEQFGGEREWLETWSRIQASNWDVYQCDLIQNHDELFDLVLDEDRTFLWTSNIYSYIIPKMCFPPFALELSFINLITRLNELHEDCWFSGTDINDNDLMCPSRAIISTTNNETLTYEQ